MTSSYMARRPLIPMSSADLYAQASPYYEGGPSWLRNDAGRVYLTEESNRRLQDEYERQRLLLDQQGASAFPGGTILHKGFYDLLALSAPVVQSVSRFWNATAAKTESSLVAGPQYERLLPATPPRVTNLPATSTPTSPITPVKKRRISKDMVSSPRGFLHLVHASDVEQAEALLTRWGPDGVGKIGDPRWALPIKNRIRDRAQAKAVAEVVAGLKPTESQIAIATAVGDGSHPPVGLPPLRVVNGISTPSTVTASTAELGTPGGVRIDGLPSPRNTAWPTGTGPHTLPLHQTAITEHPEASPRNPIRKGTERTAGVERAETVKAIPLSSPPIPPPKPKPINPTLSTLEKAASARIFFENLYFPLLRQPPSREQRRLAMEREMDQMGMNEETRLMLRERWRKNETEYLREQRKKVHVSAFKELKTIGHGAFGVVSLVKEKSTGQLFAMKQLRKVDMLRKGQEGHVRAEREVLKSAASFSSSNAPEWIVRLHYSFQDRDNLYLVLEYMGGGDLLNLLIEKDIFEENFARFYIAEMILAIESCHKQGFIHRDIKPDNFLFDPKGHIKLSDFGLATDLHWAHDTSYYELQRRELLRKHGIDLGDPNGIADDKKTKRMNPKDVERIMGEGDGEGGLFTWREKNRKKLAYSVCGTNSYMSPEVIRGHGYTFSCDWWSLGVIMFECLYGYPPFVSSSRHITRQKILNWKQSIKFPPRPRVSHEGVNLMQQLLCEPEDRIGSQASASVHRPNSLIMTARRSGFVLPNASGGSSLDGAEFLKAHPWFRGIDFANIHKQQAPFKPNLNNPEDTRHFDDDIPAEPLAPANGAAPDATRDPILKDKVHGDRILNMRKDLAFAGFTHRSPRRFDYTRVDTIYPAEQANRERGRDPHRQSGTVGRGRALSM
ncbi:hypothetical protein FRB95_006459 [Tulasnella sp. JGI-2019a]|nr:hypothetical protein FRB93_009112 [Tulasnella sp. JGI-2019a]KAG9037206.1 hypothetical protein FRB95_006459 [Tulasnella sp. JGI-2019a]